MQDADSKNQAHVHNKYAKKKVARDQSCSQDFLHACVSSYADEDKKPSWPKPPPVLSQKTLAMLQLLTFLIEKLSLLSNFKLFDSEWSADEHQERATQRVPPSAFRRGDLLEVPRTLFTHFGIYLGDNKVAHLIPDILPVFTNDKKRISTVVTNKRLIFGCMYRCATVRVDTVEDFAYGSNIIVNYMDKVIKTEAFPNEDVAKRAEKLIGAIPYSLLWSNCEHFVTYCRYGAAASQQTERVKLVHFTLE